MHRHDSKDSPTAPQRPGRAGAGRWMQALALALLAVAGGPGTARGDCADVALVLAIDGSGSINAPEFDVQQHGYAAAFRRPDVQQALQAAGVVDVAVVLWGDTEMALQILPWSRLEGRASALALADRLERMPRQVHGNTGLGRALWAALDLFDVAGQCGLRRIVNVSGDGYETIAQYPRNHVPLARARERAVRMQVTVNALAIETEFADLAEWYRDRLLAGAGAFVIRVKGFDSFAEAIARKLIREIQPPDVAFAAPGLSPKRIAEGDRG